MPAKKSAPKQVTALIAEARGRNDRLPPKLEVHLRKGLQELMEYNDSVGPNQRVGAAKAISWLSENGTILGRHTFDRLIRREFGRDWGSK